MKRVLSIFLAVLISASLVLSVIAAGSDTLLISPNPAAGSVTFTDVDKESTVGQAIYKLADAGIISGDGDGQFRPDAPIKRSELSKVVNLIFNYTEKDESGFTDLTGEEWYYSYVLVAKKAGYIQGYDDGTFKGDNHVTREQACAIVCRTAGLYDISDLSMDIEIADGISEWAVPYVQTVLANFMMSLEEGNTFRAQENITRAEFSVLFAKFVQIKETEQKPSGGAGGGGFGGGGFGGGGGYYPTPTPTPTVTPSTSPSPDASTEPSTSPDPGASTQPSTSPDPGASTEPTTSPAPSESAAPTPTPDYESLNAEMLTNLRAVSTDIANNLYEFDLGNSRNLIQTIKTCIDETINYGSTELIDADFVKTTFASEIAEARTYYDAIMANSQEKALFQEDLARLNSGTINWLANEFGLID